VSGGTQPSTGRIERRLWTPAEGGYGGRKHRRSGWIETFVPDAIADWDPPLTGAVAGIIAEADRAVADLNADAGGFAGLEALARQLLRQESVASSRIEGLVIGQRRLARAADKTEGHDDVAAQIVGNINATEQAVALASRQERFTRDDLVGIHRSLLEATRDRHIAGTVRTEQNWIGGASPLSAAFLPPPHELVEDLLDDLVRFVERDDLPVALQAAIAHAQFETIHPFADGNGRAGRCLVHVVLRRRGLARDVVPPISLVLATHSDRYVDGLTEWRFGDPSEWFLFFAGTTITAVREARSLGDRIGALRGDWLARLGNPRKDASVRKVLERLPAEPIVTVARVMEVAGVSRPAAGNAVDQLVRADVLRPLNERKWGRVWEAREVFDLLDDFERELATPDGAAKPSRPVPSPRTPPPTPTP
jgi:Fic family protein